VRRETDQFEVVGGGVTAPLAGIVVVAVEQAIAAPLATRHLADLGARVLKIEHPDGGDFARHYDANTAGQSTYFVWANRGKESLVLDLKSDDGRAQLDALIAGADVFVQNLSPGAAERAGLLAHQLVARFPALIACDISGYGLDGPRTDDKAYDLAIQSEAGAVMLTGSPEQPSKVGISIADISSAMYALSSILAALYRRDRTGEGAVISLSMLECLAEWTSPQVLTAVANGVAPERSPRRHPMIAPYGMFELSDGRTVLVAVQADREWRAMADGVLRRPELGTDERFATNAARISNVDRLEAIIGEVFDALPADEVRARLHAARVTVADVREPLDVWNHEQLSARDRKVTVTTETGVAQVLKAPFNISGLDDRGGNVPSLGEHGDDLHGVG
jgi:itaconate CoA-transferase